MSLFTAKNGERALSAECGLDLLNQSSQRGRSAFRAFDEGCASPSAQSRRRVWMNLSALPPGFGVQGLVWMLRMASQRSALPCGTGATGRLSPCRS